MAKHHPTKSERELILRIGIKSYRRLASLEEQQAAEDDLFEKRLAALHWMKRRGLRILSETENEDDPTAA